MTDAAHNGMWPSPFNQQVRLAQGRRILFSDCTLRDGDQQAGVVFDRAAKVRIARALDELGIYEIEAGTVASSDEDRDAVAEMCRIGLRAKISVLCRGLVADIDQASALGVWGVRLSFPISEIERKHKLKGIRYASTPGAKGCTLSSALTILRAVNLDFFAGWLRNCIGRAPWTGCASSIPPVALCRKPLPS
jgi:hypothetical protein